MMVGLTTNSVVDLSKDRPVSLDIIASICYYLSLTPNEVVEFIYSESTINKADYAKAGKRLDTAAKMVKARLEKQGIKPVNPEKREELYSGGLHTPLHALNASAVIREQERQKQACRKVASLFPEDKKPAAMSLTEGESNDKKNAKENESSDILFED